MHSHSTKISSTLPAEKSLWSWNDIVVYSVPVSLQYMVVVVAQEMTGTEKCAHLKETLEEMAGKEEEAEEGAE